MMKNSEPPSDFVFVGLSPELLVSDLTRSLEFWRDLCGFSVAYERAEERFVYLDRGDLQLMLKELGSPTRAWMKCDLERSFGRGVNFQFRIGDVDRLAAKFAIAGWAFLLPLEERLYRVDARDLRIRQFAAPDPDGYLVRFSQDIEWQPRANSTAEAGTRFSSS
jgi:catechol 2,3-dioxygenase-like lactoylglutathione lyase family enzyme